MTVGVYKIINNKNGKFYIGSSANCELRFYQHKYSLNKNTHHCKHLQASWNKHGDSCFSFEVLLVVDDRAQAFMHEEELLKTSYGTQTCFNSSPLSQLPFLHKHVREKAKATAQTSERYKEVHSEVCKKRNADPTFRAKLRVAISNSAKHKAATSNNAKTILQRPDVVAKNRLALKNSKAQKDAARKQVREVLLSPEIRAKNLAATSVAVIGTNIATGEKIVFPSQSAAARYVKCCSSNISECCSGKKKHAAGYVWEKNSSQSCGLNFYPPEHPPAASSAGTVQTLRSADQSAIDHPAVNFARSFPRK
jgi:group I intron endonuclease